VAVKCPACHQKGTAAALGSARVQLRPRADRCGSCHADAHERQLAGRADGGECAACHRVAGWTPSSYGIAEHARLALPLEGRHREIPCLSCHAPERGAGFRFHDIPAACARCHEDPHQGRFEPGGARPMPQGCAACHVATAWRPASVDAAGHEQFRFALRGAHRATPCAGCHRGLAQGSFAADSTCASCHQTPHGSQFDARAGQGRCDACHGEDAFRPAVRFDHERDASFALGKGHRQLACDRCHRTERVADGLTRVLYRPLSGKCESCHLRKS
jgi:hypothetical protein